MNPANQGNSTQNQGASNANDFQPTTQNPQDIETNLFQQQGSLQNTTNGQELLSDNQNATLYVNNTPITNTTSTQVNGSGGIDWMLMAILAAGVLLVASIIVRLRIKHRAKRLPSDKPTEASVAQKSKPLTPKATKKKKASKKKRRNR